ncbi:MAG: hypothetical protein ACYTG2_04995 [Planctomycetota bacterium]
MRLELLADAPPPAGALYVSVLVEPTDGRPFTVVPVRHADGSHPPVLLELTVSWQDFSGARPVAVGRARSLVLEWTGSEPAAPGRPARLAAQLEVGDTAGVLARRILVEGRLIGVDLVREDHRSGGMVLTLPPARLEAARPAPAGTLKEHLQSGSPGGIFLAAISVAPERREDVVETLVEALPVVETALRNSVFAALFYLTGEGHGTDIHRWSTWWSERRHERDRVR